MAKRPNEQSGQRPNSRLRVLFVELDGADTTIEEALRTVERMRRAPEMLKQQIKQVSNGETGTEKGPAEETVVPEILQVEQDNLSARDAEPADGASQGIARQKRGQGPKKDRNAGIELVGNLDFVPDGKPALKSCFAEKAPASDIDAVLVLCHYLQHVLELPTFGPGHILTGLKHVGKPVPVDLKQTIRNIKKEKAWLNFTDIENIRMTTEGDNRVTHELGRNGNSESA